MTEMEVLGLGLSREENEKVIRSLLERYRRQLFPGSDKDIKSDEYADKAKRMLADEAKKVYLVKSLKGQGASVAYDQAVKAGNAQLAKVAAHEMKAEAKKEAQAKSRLQRMAANKQKWNRTPTQD